MATAVQAQTQNVPTAVSKPRARRVRQFDGRDVWVVAAMAGIPTILHVGLVWIPTIFSIILSFTDWKGIRLDDINWVGFQNYVQIFTVFQKNFFQALINNSVLLELKSVSHLEPIHEAQVLTYLRLSHLPVALLINFNVPLLRHGLKRFALTPPNSAPSAPPR